MNKQKLKNMLIKVRNGAFLASILIFLFGIISYFTATSPMDALGRMIPIHEQQHEILESMVNWFFVSTVIYLAAKLSETMITAERCHEE